MSRRNKAKEKKKKDPVILALDITILVLFFVMLYVGQKAVFYKMLASESATFAQDTGMMSFELQRGDYGGLVQGRYMNELEGKPEGSGYYYLAEYVEAAFWHKVHEVKGNPVKAQEEERIMRESRVQMKELTVFADEIDKMFIISD
ncbi:MAG: hypothetical protein K6E81_07665 [Lachnospiraceae bacterium]|nr:hypothetical protein [Lachnospiraceae bacterium]